MIGNLRKSESLMAPSKKVSLNVNETKRNDGSEKQDEPRIMSNIRFGPLCENSHLFPIFTFSAASVKSVIKDSLPCSKPNKNS